MNIWILDSDSGVTIVYKPHMDMPVNEDLVSGLLTALNQFTMVEFKQPIESIDMGGLRWVYLFDKDSGLMFVAADTKDVNAEMLRSRLTVIRQSFLQEYVRDKDDWKKQWDGNVQKFNAFKNTIEEYYSQWKTAEKITTIAEFFDILGIFQQLFNLLHSVIESHMNAGKKEMLNRRVEKMFESFSNSDTVKNNPELQKITFVRESGINIININPSNCDFVIVERQLVEIMKGVVDTVKSINGHVSSLTFFVDERVFEYLFNNFVLLKELHLDQFFLQTFLLK